MVNPDEFKKRVRKITLTLLIKSAIFLTGIFYGVRYSENVKKGVHYLFYRHVPIEKGFYGDIYGLRLIREINKNGKREIYLANYDNTIKRKIGEDMISGSEHEIMGGLEERIKNSNKIFSGDIIDLQKRIFDYESLSKNMRRDYLLGLEKKARDFLYDVSEENKNSSRTARRKK